MPDVPMTYVDSSFISAAGWNTGDQSEAAGDGWLRVTFKKDRRTIEYQCPRAEFDRMMADPRPGQYFRLNIYKAGYQWRSV